MINAEFFAAHWESYGRTMWRKVNGEWEKRDTMLDRSDHFNAFCGGGEPGLSQYTPAYVEQQTLELLNV